MTIAPPVALIESVDADASVVVLPGSGIEESHDACYYAANSNMSGCKQAGVQRMRMTGKNASPRKRLCCIPCATWLREEHHAEVIESVTIAPPVALIESVDDDSVSVSSFHSVEDGEIVEDGQTRRGGGCISPAKSERPCPEYTPAKRMCLAYETEQHPKNDWEAIRGLWTRNELFGGRKPPGTTHPGLGYKGIFSQRGEPRFLPACS